MGTIATDTSTEAARLRDLHKPGDPLLLPNVWDAASASIVEEAGFPALATASAAIAAMLGHDDHEGAPAEEMLAAAGRVVRASGVPVSVDAEAGYGLPAEELVERLAGMGAAGFNIEDTDHRGGGMVGAAEQAARISRLREAARGSGRDLVVNARVDVFVSGGDMGGEDRLTEAVERGRRYMDAGADCVYPILIPSEKALATLVDGVPGPINANCMPGWSSLSRVAELGAARVSLGPVPYLRALDTLKEMAARVAEYGDPYAV
ncbi:isocitrate lyase/PEP mutase family protein [Nocardiopsis suaedae]|uniref:Isocitrate lyase/phosphoenolpyruvate mutase family protein n=1 Tax=Nocardiopsis suaedae TaxID=3018444 RepID=A0ABT4TW99_9ACTN|nr:isocitrate lyase/phosphoenolpyruvate mutase family protein [Nocardiopsis suaedae]MDA2808973.1 isocitrate lyase/phosphoenolpyruvate mutase family protein [Nocardiopsis suaedae]